MPILRVGWELHIIRMSEQSRASDGKRRTVGTYQVFHDGAPQAGAGLSGTIAETRGPGANAPAENGRRIEEGRYPIATQRGERYWTIGYDPSDSPSARPKPGFELTGVHPRTGILIHPGKLFLSSTGCFNPCTRLPDAAEMIDYRGSRRRVIALIDDLRVYLGEQFPTQNERPIPRAFVVIEGEPMF
jgi:hypothetical protein